MILIKKIDVEKHFAARRASKRAAALFASLPDATGFSGTDPDRAVTAVRDFAQDFIKEHSFSKVPAFSVATASKSGEIQAATAPGSRSV